MILPGGFAHGDYLRTGAIARFSPVMAAVQAFADAGGPLIGICNGFQVLLEAGLLPGAMLRNTDLYSLRVRARARRADRHAVHQPLRAGTGPRDSDRARRGQLLRGAGRGAELERNRQVIFRYVTPTGEVTKEANPNGSRRNIAGICNAARNVVGLMPHPERACESPLGSADGRSCSIRRHSLIARVSQA